MVIFSISIHEEAAFQTYKRGVNYYMDKPGSVPHLKKILQTVLSINWKHEFEQPSLDKFMQP
ncbi:hypothetical protein BH10BAC4_BH10BAC4_04100 [soil metagenome]